MSLEVPGETGEWRQEPSTDPEERSVSHPNDQTTSPSSDSSSPRDRSKMSCSSRSLSDSSSSETPQSVNETPKIPEKRKIKMCPTFPKAAYSGFSWRKLPPWKRSSLKPHLPISTRRTESDVTPRILSAQCHKIKELKDELRDIHHNLEAMKCENRLLRRLQHRHMKALQKYEGSEGSVHHLITQHSNEVRALRENLRATQQSERRMSLQLKTAESELLKTKDHLLRLQRLAEDKNLAEREELRNKLSRLSIKVELQSSKEKALEKQLHLTVRFYDRQLALESKKASEARDTARRLQNEILLLQQTVKEKERELHIKNIYAHRIPSAIWKCGGRDRQGGMTFTKSTQTESAMVTEEQPSAREECREPHDKSIEPANDSTEEEDNDPQLTGNESPIHEVFQDEENDGSLEIDGKNKEQDMENSSEGLDQQGIGEDLPLEDTRPHEKNQLDDSWNEHKADSFRRVESGDARPSLPRHNRHYTFTAATQNLHQGLPASGPILNSSKAHSCKSLMLQRSSSLGHEELSLPKIETGGHNEKTEKLLEVSQCDRKKKLMKELFGPDYDAKNRISSDFLTSEFRL